MAKFKWWTSSDSAKWLINYIEKQLNNYAQRHTIIMHNYILQLCKMLNADNGAVKRFFTWKTNFTLKVTMDSKAIKVMPKKLDLAAGLRLFVQQPKVVGIEFCNIVKWHIYQYLIISFTNICIIQELHLAVV